MHWQDAALSAAQIVFIVALFPTILGRDKPALTTCVLNSAVSLSIAGVYVSLALWFAATTATINCLLWLILAIQKYARSRAGA